MSTLYYEWGVRRGGTDPDGGVVAPAEAPYGPEETFTGALLAGVTTIAFTAASKRVTLRNTDDLNGIRYSFDSGTTWLDAEAHQVIQEWVSIESMQLQPLTAGTTPSYEITVVLTE
jgi:hypothetical protein